MEIIVDVKCQCISIRYNTVWKNFSYNEIDEVKQGQARPSKAKQSKAMHRNSRESTTFYIRDKAEMSQKYHLNPEISHTPDMSKKIIYKPENIHMSQSESS